MTVAPRPDRIVVSHLRETAPWPGRPPGLPGSKNWSWRTQIRSGSVLPRL